MPLILGQLDVFPGAETDSIRRALEAAAPACPSGITWTVSVYEGADLAGTRVTLDGPALSTIWTPWTQERPGRYLEAPLRIPAEVLTPVKTWHRQDDLVTTKTLTY